MRLRGRRPGARDPWLRAHILVTLKAGLARVPAPVPSWSCDGPTKEAKMRSILALILLALVGVGVVATPAVACDEHTTYHGS